MSEGDELPTFDLSQKKKKKSTKADNTTTAEEKKKIKSQVLASQYNDDDEEDTEIVQEEKKPRKKTTTAPVVAAPAAADDGEEEVLDLTKLKKKKKKDTTTTSETTTDEVAEDDASTEAMQGTPWVGTDRDYKYSELTYRVYHLLQSNNPDLISQEKRAMKTPQVFRDGSRKTVWANFSEICQILNRKPDHVLSYVFTELGTNGSVDGNQRLVIKGRFQSNQMEVVIRHYIAEYVACRNCKSPNTILERNNRLYFLCCNACNSKRSVAVIKKGLEVGKNKQKEG
eukprot:gene11948-13924_t